MIVGVPRESYPGERRVALVPSVVPTLAKGGLEVIVEAGAGMEAGYPDATYTAKSAKIVADRAEVFRSADIVAQVLCYGSNDKTGDADLPLLRKDQVLLGFLRPLGGLNKVQKCCVGAPGTGSAHCRAQPSSSSSARRRCASGPRLRIASTRSTAA